MIRTFLHTHQETLGIFAALLTLPAWIALACLVQNGAL